ncbi:hypothetical protein FRC07_011152 [Ceratobasidium sp. 392]|nr:hypothetical protein FRC07_011152 [Ceratobasidium sp. 392]
MKGLGPASVTSGSPQVPPPSSSSPTPATVASAPATTPVATTATGSLFGMSTAKPPPTFSFGTPTVSTSASPFGTPGVKLAPPSFFGPTPTASTPPPAPIPAPAPAPSMFSGFKPQATTAAPSKASVPVFAAPAMPTGPTTPQAPLSHVEAEFNKLLEQMATEFDKLRQDTVALQERHAQKARAGISLPNLQSTSDPRKWGLGDLKALKQVTSLVAKEVNQLQGLNKDFISQVTELQPGAEKVHAKKNEIARYLKAKKDPKYTRLLKSRTSSPEHVESQTKLRKSIQVVRERTRQLEDFMATQKARLQKQKEGRREFKVPSLDTINRTLRNIDVALAQKTDEIAALTARVDRMKLKAPKRKASTNGTVPLTLPAEETEKIKLASAAALNMERTSIRLKNALLQARPETPLNVSAVGAPVEPRPNALAKILPAPTPMPAPTPKPTTASTPAPAQTPSVSFAPKTPAFGARAQASLFAPKPPATPATPAMPGAFVPLKAAAPATPSFVLPVAPAALPAFSPLGKDEFHVTAGYEHSARRSEKSRMHGPSAKFKTPSPSASRTLSEVGESPVPVTPLSPLITPAKSFFGTSTPVAVQPVRNPVPFSFASPPPGGAGASAPSPGFNLFQTPAQKAAAATTTPKLPPIPDWGVTSFDSSIGSVRGSESNTTEEDEDGEGEGEEDDEEDDDWVPGDEDEDDEDEDDEDAASDDVEEGVEDDDPTV